MLKIPILHRSSEPKDEAAYVAEAFAGALYEQRSGAVWDWTKATSLAAQAHPELHSSIVGSKGEARCATILALLRQAEHEKRKRGTPSNDVGEALIALAGRLASAKGSIPLDRFPVFFQCWNDAYPYGFSYARPIGVAEELVAGHGLTPEIDAALRTMLSRLEATYGDGKEYRAQRVRVRSLLAPESAADLALPEPWQAPFRAPAWKPLLDHADAAKGTAPLERWTKALHPLLDGPGSDAFLDAFEEAVAAVGRMDAIVDSIHSDTLRGLAWTAGLVGTPRAATLLSRLAVASAHKLSGFGARSAKGFTGAIVALERMDTFEALAALSNARNRVKAASLSAALAAALERAARRQGLSVEELEEIVVPTHDLELPGLRRETLGEVEATLEIVGATEVEVRWSRGGKALKSAPAEAKALDKDLKAARKEIETALAAQRTRLEGQMLSGRTLPYPLWRERYLDHPLLAFMARRLVWRFADEGVDRLAIAPDGAPLDLEGRPLEGLDERTTVRLWHPIHAGAAAIEAWRDALVAREIRQPFKQAYREIYLLTAAEERTETYSNRFAAHFLKQHQMAALARGRGWRYALQGYFDAPDGHPTLDLPRWGLRAEYFVEVPHDLLGPTDEHMTDAGIAVYVVTDQVRFVDRATNAPVRLAEVPPVVLSEAMRDVDLLVGVASVGNDPNWIDGGERTGYGAYWREVSFGDLSASAQTRRAVLERLLPRLALGRVARLDGRFLVVAGKRRTYKIHLGSGNILMEPNDQYLCVVPGSAKGGDRVYLPFEGDGVLAIILSKAMMLADDDRITDPTITRQL